MHCLSQCVNLATEAALSESSVIRDALNLVNELGVISSQSGKCQVIFSRSASSLYDRVAKIRPLFPTRWTVRAKPIQYVLDQYESILAALEEMSKGDAATRAAGLLTMFQNGTRTCFAVWLQTLSTNLRHLNLLCSPKIKSWVEWRQRLVRCWTH